jgi:endonuclease YncB( thermonuclease family)
MKNQRPRQPRAPFTPTEAVILLLAGILILGLSGFILYNALILLNDQPQSNAMLTAQPGSPPPAGQSAHAPHPTLPPTSLLPSPTLHQTPAATTTIPPAAVPPPGACAPKNTEIRLGVVRDVLTGDTLLVELDGELVQVGYAGISAPSIGTGRPGELALEQNQALLAGQAVVLVKDVSDYDSAGRLLRYVFFSDGARFANAELVRLGYAAAIDSPDQACADVLRAAQQEASATQAGLWAPTPIPTATYLPTVVLNPDQGSCDCSVRWECSDFSSHAAAQACFNACNDYNSKLDDDHDGLACEALP